MAKKKHIYGLYYNRHFLSASDKQRILAWLEEIHPIWENRYSKNHPPPEGEAQRQLLRPVYWLGNWQFACLNYYHPPKGIENRCVRAEPFPKILQELCQKVESTTKKILRPTDIPNGWNLNTCLVNFYGDKIENGKLIDSARVGEHKDFEPGPVASISLGERAMFQFVASKEKGKRDKVVEEQWLDDSSLQIFGGERWKNTFFHRVQRVDKKAGAEFKLNISPEEFKTRRVNFTFRYVPEKHIIAYKNLPRASKEDVEGYMSALAKHSEFFKQQMQ